MARSRTERGQNHLSSARIRTTSRSDADPHGLAAGELPVDAKNIERRLNRFRRRVEDSVLRLSGDEDPDSSTWRYRARIA
ncbi:hypothetical protein NG895_23775 [Aeoliella sp. ICT_H6.2]|uniref:Uncharacterized protein n=1 Tax=Aeoliella straminimaris TaxID=2954799 RepID=A0A9X2JIK4_9BACT|nr:hypothetical protein [Aeoliella straminimaris]MCO6046931.1 hypothetical protein [Aeoliella straminimaris]